MSSFFSNGVHAASSSVTIEKQFTAGEYDILVLSAKQSDGLLLWLNENSYKMPDGAGPVLDSYIRQTMKFFVAKVNLERQAQEGRVESTNYRTIQMHTNKNVPEFIKSDFADFYRAMFDRVVTQEKMSSVITEYYWDMGWCDPCSSDPVPLKELRELGCDWLKGDDNARPEQGSTFITRLHVRYDKEHFPEDIVFQETGDPEFIQGRYIIRHPWRGKAKTNVAKLYFFRLPLRIEEEAETTAHLTGWPIERIRAKQAAYKDTSKEPEER